MTYPVPPGPRIAYDLDGSQGFVVGLRYSGGVIQGAPAWLSALNADSGRVARAFAQPAASSADTNPGTVGIAVRLATPTRLRAVAFGGAWALSTYSPGVTQLLLGTLEASADSTNGVDGTWQTLHTYSEVDDQDFTYGKTGIFLDEHNFYPGGGAFDPVSRDATPAQSGRVLTDGTVTRLGSNSTSGFYVSREWRQKAGDGRKGWREVFGTATRNVRWVRFVTSGSVIISSGNNESYYNPIDTGALFKLHLYGEPDDSSSPHRLSLVTPAGNPIQSLDWGDVFPGDVQTRDFRVKNASPTLIARAPTVRIESENPVIVETPSSWVSLYVDAPPGAASVQLEDIGPGEMSETVTLSLEAMGTVFGPVSPRLSVVTEEWF